MIEQGPSEGRSFSEPFFTPVGTESVDELTIHPSAAALALLERLRTRFGLTLEYFDSRLRPVFPTSGDTFYAAMSGDPDIRNRVAATLTSGRTQLIATSEDTYQVHPLRSQTRGLRSFGVLTLRSDAAASGAGVDAWADIVRTTLEADLAAAAALREERFEARRATAALRFFSQMVSAGSEADITHAVVHAAALWFDVDARVYRRTLVGDYAIHTYLPGAPDAPESQLPVASVPPAGALRRISFSEYPPALRWSSGDVLLATLSAGDEDEWVLALGGSLPPASEPIVAALAQSLAIHLATRTHTTVQHVREGFQALVAGEESTEQIASHALQRLLDVTTAAAGTLALHEGAHARPLASLGAASPLPAFPSEPLFAADQLVYPMELGHGRRAIIDLRSEAAFTLEATRALRAAADVLRAWLAGSRVSSVAPVVDPGFMLRIADELERAKRLDLDLAMVVIDLGGRPITDAARESVLEAVRKELRQSDLFGVLDQTRIAALLMQTDAAGVSSVLPRLQRRLMDLTRALGVPLARLGQALFSDECRTASTLVSKATQNLVSVEQGG